VQLIEYIKADNTELFETLVMCQLTDELFLTLLD